MLQLLLCLGPHQFTHLHLSYSRIARLSTGKLESGTDVVVDLLSESKMSPRTFHPSVKCPLYTIVKCPGWDILHYNTVNLECGPPLRLPLLRVLT